MAIKIRKNTIICFINSLRENMCLCVCKNRQQIIMKI